MSSLATFLPPIGYRVYDNDSVTASPEGRCYRFVDSASFSTSGLKCTLVKDNNLAPLLGHTISFAPSICCFMIFYKVEQQINVVLFLNLLLLN